MSADLQVLRTANAAMAEGLITSADYESVKASFIKAQSIKAGVDAGFISEEDYSESRKAFFHCLGMTGGVPESTPPPAQPRASPMPAPSPANGMHESIDTATAPAAGPSTLPSISIPTESAVQVAGASQRTPTAAAPPPATTAAPAAAPEVATPPPAAEKATVPALSIPEPSNASEGETAATPGGSVVPALLPTPTGLSDRGGISATADKLSMAGIRVNPDCVNILWEVNIKKTYRWVAFHIGAGGKEVSVEKVGAPVSTWVEFVDDLPDNQCRYGVFDYEYTNSDGTTYGKLCFVSWAPDDAPVKAKMQHASTKDFFRAMLEGIAVELHATDKADLAETVLVNKVQKTVAKK